MLSKLKELIKKYKKYIFLYIILCLIIITSLVLSKNNSESNNQKINNSPISTQTIDKNIQKEKFTNNDKELYYINQVVTNFKGVIGFSWNDDSYIYSTKDGIFEAGTNNIIINSKIEDIYFADYFNALVKNSGFWKKLDYKNKTLSDIPVKLYNPIISNRGNKILDFSKNVLFLYDSKTYDKKEVKFEEPIQKISYIESNENIAISTNYAARTYIYILDKNLIQTKKYETGDDYILSSVSTDGKIFTLKKDNTIKTTDLNIFLNSDTFIQNSRINSEFIDENSFIIVEKYKDKLGRTIDNIYLSDAYGKRFKISDSKPIINKIDIELPIMFNKDKNIATFAENDGRTWILSLKPNIFPTYSTTGELVFSKLNPQSH